jgi:hypothetical protein
MGWEQWIVIIAQYGLPLAEKLWTKWSSGAAPTQADWDDLRVAAGQAAKDRMVKMLLDNGIDPASEQGQLFIKLASKA